MSYNVKYRQSLFDVAAEQYGTLNNVVNIVRENELDFDVVLSTNQQLDFDPTNFGFDDIKKKIRINEWEFNNNQVEETGWWLLHDSDTDGWAVHDSLVDLWELK